MNVDRPARDLLEAEISRILGLERDDIEVVLTPTAVTLRGCVDDRYAHDRAQEIAARACGCAVKNELCVRADWAEESRALETEFGDSTSSNASMATTFKLRDGL